jgi:hypothetical protein
MDREGGLMENRPHIVEVRECMPDKVDKIAELIEFKEMLFTIKPITENKVPLKYI